MKIKIASISDIHLGHQRTSAKSIIDNLDRCFIKHPDFNDLDMVFVAGDMFDRLLPHDDIDRPEIYLWFVRLCEACAKHDIVLRILEGTPSHDWKQCDILPTIHAITKLPLDFKYVKNLSIEYIERFDCNILYVPDEWRHNSAETLSEVKDLLRSRGLDQVDFAVMHGCFEFQLPEAARTESAHNADEYLAIVKHYIFIGHHHVHSRYSRIVAQGSFDRLSHGEEEPKGFVIAHVDTVTNERDLFFIENKMARIYKSIDCSNLSAESIIEYVRDQIKNVPDNSAIRIVADKSNEIFSDLSPLVRIGPLMTWTVKKIKGDEDDDLVELVETTDKAYKAINITAENIVSLISARTEFISRSITIQENTIRHLRDLL